MAKRKAQRKDAGRSASRDERTKIDADPEDALRALVKPPRASAKRPKSDGK